MLKNLFQPDLTLSHQGFWILVITWGGSSGHTATEYLKIKVRMFFAFISPAIRKLHKWFFLWLERGDPPICFQYKMASEQCTVADIRAKLFSISNY